MNIASFSIRTAALAIAALAAAPSLAAMPPQDVAPATGTAAVRLVSAEATTVAVAVAASSQVVRTTSNPWAPLQCAVTRSRAVC